VVDTNKSNPFTHGMRLGVKVSLIAALAYAVLGVLYEVGLQIWLARVLGMDALPIARFAGMLPVGFLMAAGPAVILGMVTGGLIGELWEHVGRRVGAFAFALLGLALCALLVAGLHIAFGMRVDLTVPPIQPQPSEWLADSLGLLASYLFLFGIPSILYMLVGAGGSFCFWRERQKMLA